MKSTVFFKTKIDDDRPVLRHCISCHAIFRPSADDPDCELCPLCAPCEACGKANLFQAGECQVCPACRRPK